MTLFLGLIISLVFYFLPSMVAAINNNKQTTAIFLLNLLLGWTGIGWIGALIWAVINEGDKK